VTRSHIQIDKPHRDPAVGALRHGAFRSAGRGPAVEASLDPTHGFLLSLQRQAGNRAVVALLAAAQAKLEVAGADDEFEREADAVAARVAGAHHEATGSGEDGSAEVGSAGGLMTDTGETALSSARNGGRALDRDTRATMESALGSDLSRVRLHADSGAADLNRRMQAKAFTVGSDIFFRDGLPNPRSSGGHALLAHEVTHTVQQGGNAVVQRKLISKVEDAFDAAKRLNPAYDRKKSNTDWLVTEAEQKNLARVHGRAHRRANDSAEERTVAGLVRAVVLGEFSDRILALRTATNKSGKPMSEGEKKKKRALYNKKAEEFRQKHAPLVAAGMAGSETQSFLRQYGFEAAIKPTKRAEADARAGGARIDVRATFIGGEILGVRLRSHLFIVYTSKEGRQVYFRGGPNRAGLTVADLGDYTPSTVDWDPSAPSVTVLKGQAAEHKLDSLIEATGVINGMQVPYQATISKTFGGAKPNVAQQGLNLAAKAATSEGENCNATAWTILDRAGVPANKPGGHHPGWGSVLGSQTAGKENALPPAETETTAPEPYTLDRHRDLTDKRGLVQIYRDRLLVEPAAKVAVGTQVMLLNDDFAAGRKISFGGLVGYVPRTTDDADMLRSATWRQWMDRNVHDDDLAILADSAEGKTDPSLPYILGDLEDKGIPADYAPVLASQILAGSAATADAYVRRRVEQLGEEGARRLLSDPYEMKHLARVSGTSVKTVLAAVKAKLKDIDTKSEVRAALIARIDDPLAADIAVNEYPAYPTATEIADEVGVSFPDVIRIINECRPPARRGAFLEHLVENDPIIMSELDNPAAFMIRDWAGQLGLPEDFIRHRLRDLSALLQAQAKAQADAEAEARAKTEAASGARTRERRGSAPVGRAKAGEDTTRKRRGSEPGPLPKKNDGIARPEVTIEQAEVIAHAEVVESAEPEGTGPTSETLDLYAKYAGELEVSETINSPAEFRDLGEHDTDPAWHWVALNGQLLQAKVGDLAAFKRYHKL
jgi:Domain of unknown function (DUF4157)